MLRRLWLLAVIGAAVSFVGGCGGASFATRLPSSVHWIEIVTPHFVIHTDVAEPRALAMAQALEDSRSALLASVWPGAKEPHGRTRVMLFARQRDLSRYAGRNNQGAVFTRPGFQRLLALTPGSMGNGSTVAAHELAHDLSRWFLPVQPLWLSEGLAVYLESIELDRRKGQVVTGGVSSDSVGWLRAARFIPSTAQLFALRDPSAVDARDTASFYLGSWALVHYLRSEQPDAFGRFQKALMRLTPWRLAWDQSFPGLTSAELDRRLSAYLDAERFTTSRAHFTPPVFTPTVRGLPPAEVHGLLALLANTSGEPVGATETAAALDLDPAELNALTVRFHSLAADARVARTDIASRAVDAHPHQAGAWLLAALAATELGVRRRALARAERLDPDHPGVVGLLAEDALARNDPRAALVHVRHAQRRSGVTPKNLTLQFAALAASNRCEDAAAILERGTLLLDPQCRVAWGAGHREVTCSDYVRRAYADASSCAFEAL
jgi:hypothetical protein